MKLTVEQVRHVAKLARLELKGEDEAKLQGDLSRILESFEALSAVDTGDVPPTARVFPAQAVRPDEVRGELGVEKALANAPQKHGTSFAVPKFLD
jgi:aspartyl-tRNA(Asn)/glutamyl-tRNA(Gln) amidotransferase subunit C